MKQKLLKTIGLALLCVVGASNAWAQSTYSWSASNWGNDSRGEVTVESGALKVTKVDNHLIGIKSTTEFKLPKRQTLVVVTGTGFVGSETGKTDPNISINGGGQKKKVKEETTTTRLVFDITDMLPEETDFFGNVKIKQVNLIIKTSEGEDKKVTTIETGNPTITNIEFFQPDFLDIASLSNIDYSNTNHSDESLTAEGTDLKKTLAFTQTGSTGDMSFKVTATSLLNSSDAYFVIESNINDKSKLKVRNLTIDDNAWANNTSNNSNIYTISEGHYVVIASPIGTGSETSNNMWEHYQDHATFNVSYCQVYVKNTQNAAVKIYRAGLYNLAEILKLYPSLKSSKDWQLVSANSPRVTDDGTGGNTVKFKGGSGNTSCTLKQMTSLIRTLGNMPSEYTNLNLHGNTTLIDDAGNVPLTEDVLSDFTNNPYIMFNPTFYKYYPTMSAKVKVSNGNYKYYQYKDGTEPATSYTNPTTDGAGSSNIYSFTRNFKADYNSCVLPFDVTISELPTGLSAWVFDSATTEGEVTFTPASGTLSAGTPCIIKADEAGFYLIPAASTPNQIASPESYYATDASNGIKFVGSFVNEVPGGTCTNYGITTDGTKFAKMGDGIKTTYYRAFISDQRSGSGASYAPAYLDIVFGGTTGISDIEMKQNVMEDENAPIYNLNGVRMNGENLPKGIYIKNGKKFVIK